MTPGSFGDRPHVVMLDSSDRGGIARYTSALVTALEQQGVDIALAAPKGQERRSPPLTHVRWGHEVDSIPRSLRKVVGLWEVSRRAQSALRAVRIARPRVVHLQTPVGGPFDPWLVRIWKRRGIAVVRTVHNAVAHEATRSAARDRTTWALVDVLIAHGESAAAELRIAVPDGDIRSIPVDLPESSPPSRDDARRRLDLGEEPLAVLLGLIRPYKGVELLAAAWPAVRDAVPDARLAVVGSLLEPMAELDRLAALDGVDVQVGWLSDDDVAAWAAAGDICLLPYAHGAHSAILHQAVVAATPVIASPSLREEVVRFSAGPIVELESEQWSAAIAGALDGERLPPPRRLPGGEQARTTAAVYRELIDR